MTATISKTFRLEPSVVQFLTDKSKEWSTSQSDTLKKMIDEYKKYIIDKQYEADLIAMSKDKEYMKEMVELADANWL